MKKLSKRYHLNTLMKTLCVLLLAITLLPLAAPVKAEESKVTNLFGSSLMDQQGYILTMVSAGDTLYIATSVGLYTYAPGDTKAMLKSSLGLGDPNIAMVEEVEGPQISVMFSDGQRLLGLDTNEQALYTITLEGERYSYSDPVKLDLSDFIMGDPPYQGVSSPQWVQVMDGRLYMKKNNWEDLEHDLFSFDLKTGEKKVHDALHLQTAAPYKDGKIIAVQLDPNNRFDMNTGTLIAPPLVIFDPADESITALDAAMPVNDTNFDTFPFYYDAQEDSLYTFTDTDVLRMDGDMKEARLIGYLPMFGSYFARNGGIQPLPDGRLAISAGQNVFLRERTEKGLEGFMVLSMSGGMDDPTIITRALMELDNVVVRRVEGVQYNYIDAEQLASMFLTGSVPADIMAINVNGFDLDKLIQKGYLADLSASGQVKDYLSAFAPNLSKAFVQDGKIYALPTSLILFPVHANSKAFEEIGQPVPTSLDGLTTLTEEWMAGLMEDHPNFNLFSDGGNYKRTLTYQVIEKYIANKLGAGEDLVFDTPAFRGLMERVANIDFGDYATDPDWEDPAGMSALEEFWNRTSILETGMGYEPRYATNRNRGSNDNPQTPITLSIEEGQMAYADADLNLLVVLSSSKNIDTAVRFLGAFTGKIDPVDKAAFNLDARDPIPNPNYDREMADLDKTLKVIESNYAKAEGAEKSNLEESLKYFKEHYEHMRKEGMFLATAQDLENIHQMISHLYVNSGLGNAQRRIFYDNYELMDQYQDGAISLDQFIRQMDDKLRLVRMEYQ